MMPFVRVVLPFLAAYTAVNGGALTKARVRIFLAAYTAVNLDQLASWATLLFLAAYTAVNLVAILGT